MRITKFCRFARNRKFNSVPSKVVIIIHTVVSGMMHGNS